MFKNFKAFWKELFEIEKEYYKWCGRHWIGIIICNIVVIFGALFSFKLIDKITYENWKLKHIPETTEKEEETE